VNSGTKTGSGCSSNSGPGCCTPGILQVDSGSTASLSDCPQNAPPSSFGGTTTTVSTSGIANLNINRTGSWTDYLTGTGSIATDTPQNRALFARFMLCSIINPNMDLSIYINENEFVTYTDSDGNAVTTQAKDCAGNGYCYQYIPSVTVSNYSDGLTGSGVIKGQFGICNDRTYKLHQFVRKIGIWIFLGLILLAFIWMAFTSFRSRGKGGNSGSAATE
jgi:hypothetical protein